MPMAVAASPLFFSFKGPARPPSLTRRDFSLLRLKIEFLPTNIMPHQITEFRVHTTQLPLAGGGGKAISYATLFDESRNDTDQAKDTETLLRHHPAICADATRLSAQHALHPVGVALNGAGEIGLYDILGELSSDSEALSDLSSINEVSLEGRWTRAEHEPHLPNETYIHYRLPVYRPLSKFADVSRSARDIVGVVLQGIVWHADLYESGELHRRLDLNTILGAPGLSGEMEVAGFLFDYEPANEYRLKAFPLADVRRLVAGLDLPEEQLVEVMAGLSLASGALGM
ncbi:hypothetical protein GLOTRDRAFT_126067 [Gloeophyllum trabeum ATCC 11539]|uniref:Fungal-type protein kinase domain-containing protein n=1 Tax=Gloeophyllum trabeum (strain ATCC 11539 / FP-39264 / Madison 617) TaxID=670483 RepID=S7RXV4_GLOTA|nr:uncharacterized protein GLOTRDRAFT_126067 [Gloeophyllum trabeum ATCC 11539]EPQ59770.1 hypothetical protein GLOTRDRAFT_126067 [Gloeophyllum trabeum ATCC 11539]